MRRFSYGCEILAPAGRHSRFSSQGDRDTPFHTRPIMDRPSQAAEGEEPDTAPNSTNTRWFYIQHGETYGPVSSADLRAAAHLGFIGPDDLVRRCDRSDWVAAHTLRGLCKSPK